MKILAKTFVTSTHLRDSDKFISNASKLWTTQQWIGTVSYQWNNLVSHNWSGNYHSKTIWLTQWVVSGIMNRRNISTIRILLIFEI